LRSIAQDCVDRQQAADRWPRYSIGQLPGARVALNEGYCKEVAAYYASAPALAWDGTLRRRYGRLKEETLGLYQTIIEAGITVEPWLEGGQPYRSSGELREDVRRSGRLRIYLTDSGHGRRPSSGYHPLREPSGISVAGVEFRHNDLFRAVHDVFGHVMLDAGFGIKGEFLAAFCQLAIYPREVHPVLFTEQVGQICWFFYGPHLMNTAGALPRRGETGYIPPARRPYPEQKVCVFPGWFLDAFTSAFHFADFA